MTDTNQLLREYARSGSEEAFRELVSRYVDLVYSVAVRRLGGDEHLARDVVQTVFIDLARKAVRLRSESSLGGWLHRHTCFVSSNFRRTAQRCAAREQIAMEMNRANESTDAGWEQLAPVLDEAIDQLGEPDRKAIVMRYYERRDLRSVGLAIGTNEDAAQKRVTRALEKLREVLTARGASLSGTALAAVLAGRAVSAAPADLAAEVGSKALTAAGGTGLLTTLMSMMTLWRIKLAVGMAAALAVGALIYTTHSARQSAPKSSLKVAASEIAAAPSADAGSVANGASVTNQASGDLTAPAAEVLELTILAADSGRPVPGVQVNYRGWEKEKFSKKQFVSNRGGRSDVPVSRATITDLELTSVAEGFADARLAWRPDRGETIPPSYTLRLTRPVPIGGRVLDPDDQPIAGAKMGWNHQEDGSAETRPESHAFGWIEVETDSDGRWEVNRIAPEMVRRLYGTPQHPEYVAPPLLMVSENAQAEQQLREGTHVFRMGRALSVSGTVVDPDDQPLADAVVRAGNVGEASRREAKSASDGTFVVTGCKPGKNLITAEAAGFTATTLEVDVKTNTPPVRLKLARGKVLRLRLVDKAGQPIPDANVWYNTFRNEPSNLDKPAAPPTVQVEFSPKTDAEGRAIWENAPDGELTFSFHKQGFMRQDDVKVDADGQEHVITLAPALAVSGTVVDATTRQPIPKFRIACGWPSAGLDGQIQARFSSIDRFWLSFADGNFRHSFEEALIVGMKNPGYMLKFQAEGYAPFLSRVIKEDEGEVRLDVTLDRATELLVTVLLPEGQAAPNVDVALLSPGRDIRLLMPSGFSRWNSEAAGGLLQTDGQGQVRLPPDDEIRSVVAAGEAGFAQATLKQLRADPKLQLQPWGRIEGAYASGARAANRKMSLGPVQMEAGSLQFDIKAYQVQTDGEGRFTFAKVPPGTWKLNRMVPMEQTESHSSWRDEPVQDVDVRPGETLSLTLGGGTRTVNGRIRLPAGMERRDGMRLFAFIHTPFPKPPAEVQNDPAALQKWGQSPEVRAIAQKARGYQLRENADGTWSAEEVAPGQYIVSVSQMANQPDPNTKPLVAEIPVTVQEGAEPLDLGELALQAAP
jgi:RNA polymerase sigma factor (sigma-70 family)